MGNLYEFGVIGAGPCGLSTLYSLGHLYPKLKNSRHFLLHNNSKRPVAGLAAPAIVSDIGLSGLDSEHKTLISQGVSQFPAFLKSLNFDAFEQLTAQYLVPINSLHKQEFLRQYPFAQTTRFGQAGPLRHPCLAHQTQACVFCPQSFLTHFKRSLIQHLPQLEVVDDRVQKIEMRKNEIVVYGQQELRAKKLVIATGAYTAELVSSQLLTSPGYTLQFHNVHHGHSFHLRTPNHSLTYRGREKVLILGTFAHNPYNREALDSALLAFRQWEKLLCFPSWWPAFENGLVMHGMRSSGVQRRPLAKLISPHVAVFSGLGKNGFSISLELSRKIIQKLYPSSPQLRPKNQGIGYVTMNDRTIRSSVPH